MQILHLLLSMFAVEKCCTAAKCSSGSETAPGRPEEMNMRIFETATVGLLALAAQLLVVATVFA